MKPLEIAQNVFRLGTKWANFYLVRDGGEWTMIDAGYPGYFAQLADALDALGSRVEAVRGVIVTHHHVDHAGTAEAVRSRSAATVFVHSGDAAIVPASGDRTSRPVSIASRGARAWPGTSHTPCAPAGLGTGPCR